MLYRDLKVMFGGGAGLIVITCLCLIIQKYLFSPLLWCFILSFFFLLWCGIFIHGLPVQRIWILLLLLIGGVLVLCMTALYVLKQAFFHDWMLALISLFSS